MMNCKFFVTLSVFVLVAMFAVIGTVCLLETRSEVEISEEQRITPDEAAEIVDDNRPGGIGAWQRTKTYLGNRFRKAFYWLPGNSMTPEMYDRELEDSRNRFRHAYLLSELKSGKFMDLKILAAVQEKHYRDARMRVQDARRTMGDAGARAKGYDDRYPESFLTLIVSPEDVQTKNAGGRDDSASRYKWSPEKVKEERRMYGAKWGMQRPNKRFY